MYHSAMSNLHIRMQHSSKSSYSLQNNVNAIMSTSLLCPWRLKVKSYNTQAQQQGLISCEVVVTESTCQLVQLKSNEHQKCNRPLCDYDIVKVAIYHIQHAHEVNPTDHHRTTNAS